MSAVFSFPPIENASSRVLILGSMPGIESLKKQEYYAHKRNKFWTIMCDILGVSEYAPYDLKVEALKVNGIALWDVLRSCRREGSLDSAIDETTEVANEFAAFFRKHPKITHVFFNGGKAERSFNKHVIGTLGENARKLTFYRLPSTSPANASWDLGRKRKAWAVIAHHSLLKTKGI